MYVAGFEQFQHRNSLGKELGYVFSSSIYEGRDAGLEIDNATAGGGRGSR